MGEVTRIKITHTVCTIPHRLLAALEFINSTPIFINVFLHARFFFIIMIIEVFLCIAARTQHQPNDLFFDCKLFLAWKKMAMFL